MEKHNFVTIASLTKEKILYLISFGCYVNHNLNLCHCFVKHNTIFAFKIWILLFYINLL